MAPEGRPERAVRVAADSVIGGETLPSAGRTTSLPWGGMGVLVHRRAAVDVDGFWKRGYTIVRGVYSPLEISRFRDGVEASRGLGGDLLSNPRLRDVIVDGRLVEIARQILGRDQIVYAGDSSFTVGMRQRGWHKDNTDRKDPNGPDWQGRYTILRFGVYLQDHRQHTGGLNLRVGSHTTTDQTEGKNVYVRTGVGDVGVWSLRITHSGNGTLLRFPWWKFPAPGERRFPKWYRVADADGVDRMALFVALGLDDHHQDRYTTYLKTRAYMVSTWRQSAYDDEALARAAAVGLKVRNVPLEIDGDDSVGQNVGWAPLPY
jgi:hypothetical protein